MQIKKQKDAINLLAKNKALRFISVATESIRGFPDTICIYNNVGFFCEIKTNGTTFTSNQLDFLRMLDNALAIEFIENKFRIYTRFNEHSFGSDAGKNALIDEIISFLREHGFDILGMRYIEK